MRTLLEESRPEEFEALGKEMMRTCWEVEQAVKVCAPKLHAYELTLRPLLQRQQAELARVKHQARALHEVLYNRIVPVCDAQMLAHSRKVQIVAFLTVLTALACLVGNAATFYLMGAGPLVALLAAIGLTALPLGISHMAHEWIFALHRWFKILTVLVIVLLAASGIVIAGQARRTMIDRSIRTPIADSYVDGSDVDNKLAAQPATSDGDSELAIRRSLGEGIFLIVLAAELALVFLVGWLIDLYADPDNTAWRKLHSLEKELSDLEVQITKLTHAPEVAKRCCLAGILAVDNARTRRHPPYHQALTFLLMLTMVSVATVHAQTIEHYDAILIDTSASISRGGKTNALFQQYLAAARSLLVTELANTRVWVLSISSDSFGASPEILKGWTPEARGVFTENLSRARSQLASNFERKSSQMNPTSSHTDIFGALWHVYSIFEGESEEHSAQTQSKTIWIISDMMNETQTFSMPDLLHLGPEEMVKRAQANALVAPLKGYKVRVLGASPSGLTPQTWFTAREFWRRYFAAGGAGLLTYAEDCEVAR